MTAEDLVLPVPAPTFPLTLYRLTRARYADLSGIGASMYPGRWNCKGQRVVYTSLSLSTAVLETLAHTDKTEIPDNLVKMEIEISFPPSIIATELGSPPNSPAQNWQRFISVR
ncbi:MAG: RES domain-containing protein [Acidobacteriaceae bacterium]|nr:RES domain-containing protein [Acidobacteriaceae bacterium]